MKENVISRFYVGLKNADEAAYLFTDLKRLGYLDLTIGFGKYAEFFFIYPNLIVDTLHKTIQSDSADVKGGCGKYISYNDFMNLINNQPT